MFLVNWRRFSPCLIATGLVMWTACQNTRSVPESVFQTLEKADQVEITTLSKQVRTIVQPWRIRKAARLLRHYADGWRKPLSGTPLSDLIIGFRQRQNVLGRFGVGHDFITMGEDLLWCQALDPKDRAALLDDLAVEERAAAAPQ
jgi:hypothetical protein